jgi:hypothetical protein
VGLAAGRRGVVGPASCGGVRPRCAGRDLNAGPGGWRLESGPGSPDPRGFDIRPETRDAMTRHLTTTLFAVSSALCTSLAVAAAAEHHGHHHHQFAKDIDAFHAVLAPIWHSSPGKERQQAACAKAGEMQKLAREVRSADARALDESVARLNTSCKSQPAGVDKALHDVHEAFHGLIEPKKPAAAR